MPLVYVDLIELVTLGFLALMVMFLGGMAFVYLITPSSARNILKGKWLKRGKRNLTTLINDDNVSDIQVGRPKGYGIKIGKGAFLVPRGGEDNIVNRRSILAGTGLPHYSASSRSGLACSPDFVQLASEVMGFEVEIVPKNVEDQKPKFCLKDKCKKEHEKPNIRTVYKTVEGEKKVDFWECEFCKSKYTPVTLLNPHVMGSLGADIYDSNLIEGIEQDARDEARAEKPSWFIWGIILFVPYALTVVAMVLFTQQG